jgi:hypothetical protein
MQEAVLFLFLFRLFRLRGGSFLQELYDFEKILVVKKVNADTLLSLICDVDVSPAPGLNLVFNRRPQ